MDNKTLFRILFILGTRPEAIKMAPLIKTLEKKSDSFETKICVTAQHREMLDQVLDFFNIEPHYDLNIMKEGQTLFDITIRSLDGLKQVLDECEPDLIFIQGDTTTVLTGAIAGYYKRIDVAHLEAGLRSFNKLSPYPEEMNRILASHLSKLHFAPTFGAVNNLTKEGITKNVWQVGNTVIDALFLGLKIIREAGESVFYDYFKYVNFSKKIILVTGHRRESFGKPLENICNALKTISELNDNVEIIYPMHLNPNVREPVRRILDICKKVHLIDPLEYPYMLWLMNKSYIVITDSGGIQEEAPSLGKPVLVMRDVTERTEGIEAGNAILVGTDQERIISETNKLLNDFDHYEKMSKTINPYGDGTASDKIADILIDYFKNRSVSVC